MNIRLNHTKKLIPNSTGFKLRERRKELGLSSIELEKLSKVSKGQILKAEKSYTCLNKIQYEKLCRALKIDPKSIIDNAYILYYTGYEQAVELLIEKLGVYYLLNIFDIQYETLINWKTGKWTPQFKNRQLIVHLYNKFIE